MFLDERINRKLFLIGKKMKTIRKLILVLSGAAIVLLGSCVSSKKYNASVSQNAQLEKQMEALQASNAQLEGDINHLKGAVSNDQRDLNTKDRMLADEQKKMVDMKALVD